MKKALLVISFGTSYPQALQKNIAACEQALANAFPDRDFFRAFTSSMIIKKLSQRDGMDIAHPREALAALKRAGYRDVLIQSLHIINGDEYEKIVREVAHCRHQFERIEVGVPLLSDCDDYQRLIDAIEYQSPPLAADERLVLMGHGTTHHAFSAYACLDHMMQAHQRPFIVGAVESYPGIETVISRLQQAQVRKVYLMPLMLVAGDHAIHDMASDDPDSWKVLIEQAGIAAEPIVQGLGENPLIRQLFIDHLTAVSSSDMASQEAGAASQTQQTIQPSVMTSMHVKEPVA
ncbi:sirohydrochlorin cobaltochelatase [Vibrio sp. MEBiC08052]|uniref:sirohydrochlorin cobaltochelatase n=1 Tax=Vibrio sp. MEBiC08052 TaxID=1761910 RepID=UPI0007408302|nr:sirohydrochlorin cobaltochelatase [Vibrio sp. MEBiC08052]KUI98232.1 Sirohydrochlorin cobaltochelatase [Vibrio sp. MEBiC08052]